MQGEHHNTGDTEDEPGLSNYADNENTAITVFLSHNAMVISRLSNMG